MSRMFGAVRQVAMVVDDIDAAMKGMIERFGIGPFFVAREFRPDDFHYRGAPSPAPSISLAFAFSGDLNLELIQQHDDAPSAYRDFLSERGAGVQHMSSWTALPEEYDAARARALAAGHTIRHEGRVGNSRFAYVDIGDDLFGMCFELAEGLSAQLAPVVARMHQQARDWDGSDPIRAFG